MPFEIAISGLRAAQNDLEVIGNNVANVNTTGYKGSRAEFHDVFSAGGGPGQGVSTARVAQQFAQGNITFTDNGLDLAISGDGFFILDDNGERVYSRDGAFGLDRDGFVVNSNNQQLNAYGADSTGAVSSVLGPLQISSANTAPSQTSRLAIGVNLDSQAAVPITPVLDPADNTSFNNTTATTIFDSLGGSHLMQTYFVKTATPNAWESHTYVDGTAVAGPTVMTFDTAGALVTPAGGTFTIPAFTPAPGTAPLNLTVNVNQSTQFGAPFGVTQLSQDGYTTGRLAGLDIDSEGVIFTRYTNGQFQVQGQVALANFANVQGLQSLGNNTWSQTFAAGDVLEGGPGTGNLGLLQAGALEDSNVDLSEQLVKLIIAQRNFQANTEVISTADSITQAVMNIR
ncbi:MAG: flagellar hook protein FlgE [Gammaproteobacteria bacterium]